MVSVLKKKQEFVQVIIEWGEENTRNFFWRERDPLSPFKTLVVELLLVRTKAPKVNEIGDCFVENYDTPQKILQENEEILSEKLYPLGLSSKRTTSLKKIAKLIVESFDGVVPKDVEELMSLPFVGRYTANATLCFGCNRRSPIVDSNIARLLHRFFNLPAPKQKLEKEEEYWDLAERLLPHERVKHYNWSLIDFGNKVCTKSPVQRICPLSNLCKFNN